MTHKWKKYSVKMSCVEYKCDKCGEYCIIFTNYDTIELPPLTKCNSTGDK